MDIKDGGGIHSLFSATSYQSKNAPQDTGKWREFKTAQIVSFMDQ